MFPPAGLPLPGELLLITDELPSPADFLLHKLLADHLKHVRGTGAQTRCLILATLNDPTRWKHIAAKSNVSLDQHTASRRLSFIDVLGQVQSSATLRPLYDSVRAQLKAAAPDEGRTLVILDDLSPLEWIGYSTIELSRFLRALSASCREANAALVMRHHLITPGDPDDLLRHLLQLASYHVDVRPLSSGRSGAVSGEIALHAGTCCPLTAQVKVVPRSSALQYRLTDAGATFFNKGTSAGVL
ncbi:uncharacterized protein B0H18DRAFT_1038612 [Fomitopsis serialis]|uniref:uncharacterized protein n=1 Tax=Fomitopsis serialis TaxID=139415 RepID=UPI0020085EA1|nr:uncharacterized protein B0H18DRAFT_1038612 [Neoantrodia serialis]KAH9916326.1 hypothetical protein B0H18DRAFT_1038612 [Neoantrodia serialis]